MSSTDTAELGPAIENAIAGKPTELFRRLELGSGLPGPRINQRLAMGFANDCARLGAKAEGLAYQMAEAPPDEARGASTKEFLSVCGVLAVGVRIAQSVKKERASRTRALALFEERADDPRFRVRDAVPLSLAMLGGAMGLELCAEVHPWMDRYFHAAAVILALQDPTWLETMKVDEHEQPIELLHEAFLLAESAPRSAARYPGHKALVEALRSVPKAFIKRFGLPMFERLGMWSKGVKIPELREVILANLEDTNFKKAYASEVRTVRAAVEASKKPPRDPTKLIQGMRGRAKRRAKR